MPSNKALRVWLLLSLETQEDVARGREVGAGKGRPRMPETIKARDLLATLRDALHQLEVSLERTRDGVDTIASQTERLRAGVEALGALRQREPTAVGIEMFVDAAVDLLEAFRELESGILDVQAEVDTLAADMADDENVREAERTIRHE